VARRQWFSRSPGGGPNDPWFRIGTVDVGTSALVSLIAAATLVLSVIVLPLFQLLPLSPPEVLRGQIWRLFTWPFISDPRGFLWAVINMALFWYFGKRLEEEIGRVRMAKMVAGLVLASSVLAVVFYLVLGPWVAGILILSGLGTLQLVILLIFIAQYPRAMFLFNIPGWVIGAVLVALQVLGYLVTRNMLALLHFLVALAASAVIARSMGLLTEYAGIPHLGSPSRPSTGRGRQAGGAKSRFRRRRGGGQSVVTGPWAGSSSPDAADRARLDALLDKIGATGMTSLSSREVKELHHLRKRLRGE
jgi:membrane associated rhomboid family serine protease